MTWLAPAKCDLCDQHTAHFAVCEHLVLGTPISTREFSAEPEPIVVCETCARDHCNLAPEQVKDHFDIKLLCRACLEAIREHWPAA